MKKTRLALGRETIRHLESAELARIAGGAVNGTATFYCTGTASVYPCTTYYNCTVNSCYCGSDPNPPSGRSFI